MRRVGDELAQCLLRRRARVERRVQRAAEARDLVAAAHVDAPVDVARRDRVGGVGDVRERAEPDAHEPQRRARRPARASDAGRDALDPVEPRHRGVDVAERSDHDRDVGSSRRSARRCRGSGRTCSSPRTARSSPGARAAQADRAAAPRTRRSVEKNGTLHRLHGVTVHVDASGLHVEGVAAGAPAARRPGRSPAAGRAARRTDQAVRVAKPAVASSRSSTRREEIRTQRRRGREVGGDESDRHQHQHDEHEAGPEAHVQPSAGLRST